MEATGRKNAGHHVGGLATLEGTETTPAASYCLVSLSASAYWRLGDSRHSRGLRRYVAIGSAGLSEAWSSLGAFLFYVVTYGIGIFFNAALAICVLRKLAGKPVSILDGVREAAHFSDRYLAGRCCRQRWAWS